MRKRIKNIGSIFRPLTKNEKFLLVLLGYTIILGTIFKFIVFPQIDEIEILQNKKMKYRNKILEYNEILEREDSIKEEQGLLGEKMNKIRSNYFLPLNYSEIFYVLMDLTEDEDFQLLNFNFSNLENEIKGEDDVEKIEILIPFRSTYDGILRVVKSISNSPKKIIVDKLSFDRDDSKELTGYMNLKIYGLNNSIESHRQDVIPLDILEENYNKTPFEFVDEYEEDKLEVEVEEDMKLDNEEIVEDVPNENSHKRTEVLYDFEDDEYDFIPSNPLIKGSAVPFSIAKSGNKSLRFEYNILAFEEENRAYIDLSSKDIMLRVPPDYIGIWIYSYGYFPGTLGMRFVKRSGENMDVEISNGIDWLGWSYLKKELPKDLKSYPLKLDKIFYQVPKAVEDFGVILMDKLEVCYPNNTYNSLNDFYIVQTGDTIDKISEKIYGTKTYGDELIRLNDIYSEDMLYEGRVLVFKRY